MNRSKWSRALRCATALGAVALSLVTGCGGGDDDADDDQSTAAGAQGDSCTRTADCGPQLRCVGNTCSASAAGDAAAPGTKKSPKGGGSLMSKFALKTMLSKKK